MGIRGIVLSGYSPCPPRPELSKTALGADETVQWWYFEEATSALIWLAQDRYNMVALEQTQVSIPIQQAAIPDEEPICLILGNEVYGVDDELLSKCSQILEIPQYGNKHSFNVSVAAGIALFALHELYRNR